MNRSVLFFHAVPERLLVRVDTAVARVHINAVAAVVARFLTIAAVACVASTIAAQVLRAAMGSAVNRERAAAIMRVAMPRAATTLAARNFRTGFAAGRRVVIRVGIVA